nr:uncharacterized protein LOC111417424 isoform X1 [Onthophagus taurus]
MPQSRRAKTAAALLVAEYWFRKEERKRKKRKIWVREWIERRNELGAFKSLVNELRIEDSQQFRNFIRMSSTELEDLLFIVGPKIQKQDTVLRELISASEKLMVTLRFLATGDSYNSLMYLFRIPACTISIVVPEVCKAIFDTLKETLLKVSLLLLYLLLNCVKTLLFNITNFYYKIRVCICNTITLH